MKNSFETSLPFDPQRVAPLLLAWYREQGRDLPWRQTRDPYRIWLSEIMLQQTTVAAVTSYYQKFLDCFPTVAELAAAPLGQVIDLWAGLGYYARARNLHAAAVRVAEEYGGKFPQTVEELQRLPGVGRSTAGAIAALAFDLRAPILDGNVRRVLCRLFAYPQPVRSTAAEKQFWHWSELLTPQEHVHNYTQAVMDLGATVCLPRTPRCGDCPIRRLCQARLQGLAEQLPLKPMAKKVPVRYAAALLIEHGGRYLVRRRPASGFLGGLWEFPEVSLENKRSEKKRLGWLQSELSLSGDSTHLGEITHLYSHFRLCLQLYQLNVADRSLICEGEIDWCSLRQLQSLALHGAHKKALKFLED